MAVLVIRPGASSAVGAVRSSNATYSVARAGGGAFTVFSSGAGTIPGGQRLFSGTYDLNIQFFNFSPVAAVPGAVISDVTYEWTTASINVAGGDQQAILNFASGSITSADWCDGSTLATLDVWGEIPGSGYQNNSQTYQVPLNSTAIAAVQTLLRSGSSIGFAIVAQGQIDGVAPTGNDRYDILSDDDPTEINRPALIITYTTEVELYIPDTAGSVSPLPPILAIGSATNVPLNLVYSTGILPVIATDAVIRLAYVNLNMSTHDVVGLGPLWRAVNENQAVWGDRVSSVTTWTPVSAA